MLRFIAIRIGLAVPVLVVMTMLTFLLAGLVPGNAATTILGQDATPERVAALTRQLGLDRPVWEQYWAWLTGLFQGDWGTSLYSGESISRVLAQRIGPTLSVAILATAVSAVIGVALGTIAAVRGGVVARIVDVVAMLGISVPNFWVALLLIVGFAGSLRMFPSYGYTPLTEDVGQWIGHLVLPVAAISFASLALVAKQTRESVTEAMSRDFMRFLQANGIPRTTLIVRYALRYAAIPITATISATFIMVLGGTVLIETVFAIPGLGSLVSKSTTTHDLSAIQGAVLAFTIIILVVNLLTDVVYSALNPKVRLAS
jgi:peptide/nickel transport system permease protein